MNDFLQLEPEGHVVHLDRNSIYDLGSVIYVDLYSNIQGKQIKEFFGAPLVF